MTPLATKPEVNTEHRYADYTRPTNFVEAAIARAELLMGVMPRTLLSSWNSMRRVEGLPSAGFGPRQFGEGALDEFAVAMVACLRRVPSPLVIAQGVDDCLHIADEFRELGPESCNPAPDEFRFLNRSAHRYLGVKFEQIDYVSQPAMPSTLIHEGFGRKEIASARVLRHEDISRPWVVWLHGAAQGTQNDLIAFRARHWHETLGFNVVMPVMPLHGHRKKRALGYPTFDLLTNTATMMRMIWDTRSIIRWINEETDGAGQGERGPIRVGGMSLGAPIAAMVAGLDESVESVAAVVPLLDLHRTMARHLERAGAPGQRIANLMQSAPVRAVDSAVDPLLLDPFPVPERRLVIAGLNDRLTGSGSGYRLHQHWGGQVQWHDGGHIGQFWSGSVRRGLDEFFAAPTAE